MENKLLEYYEYALNKHNAHPLDLESANYICNLINQRFIFRMLEIGSGTGYSANYFALNSNMTEIVSLEKQFGMYLVCKKRQLSDKITFLWQDFRTYEPTNKFPLIFIDASKTNQKLIFNKSVDLLKSKGLIIIDNIFMNRLRKKESKNSEKIIKKANEFKEFLLNLETFDVQIVEIGDGIAICQKKD